MHQDSLQLQACQNPLDDQKHKSLKSWYSENTLIVALGHVEKKKLPISRERFWVIIFSLDRNDINNFGPKGQPFKTILTWEEMLQSERSSMICIVARSRQTMRTRKEKKTIKEKMIVMHLKNSSKSKRESRKPNSRKKMMKKKWLKNCINTSHSSIARNHSSV